MREHGARLATVYSFYLCMHGLLFLYLLVYSRLDFTRARVFWYFTLFSMLAYLLAGIVGRLVISYSIFILLYAVGWMGLSGYSERSISYAYSDVRTTWWCLGLFSSLLCLVYFGTVWFQ